jgi:hypothetical protein
VDHATLGGSAHPRVVRRDQGRVNAAWPRARSATRWRVPHREAPWRMQPSQLVSARRAYSYCSKATYNAHVSSSIQSKLQQLSVPSPLLYSVRCQHHCRTAAKPPPCASQHHLAAPPLSLLRPDTAKPPPNSRNAPSPVTSRSSGRPGCTTPQAAGV